MDDQSVSQVGLTDKQSIILGGSAVAGCAIGMLGTLLALQVSGVLGNENRLGAVTDRTLTLTQARVAMADIGKGGVMVTGVAPGPDGSGLTAAYVRTGESKKASIVWLHGARHPFAVVGNLYNERGDDINAPYLNLLNGHSEVRRASAPVGPTLSMYQPPFDTGKFHKPVPAAEPPEKTALAEPPEKATLAEPPEKTASAEPPVRQAQATSILPQASLLDPTKHNVVAPEAVAPQAMPAGASIAAQRKAAILAYMATSTYQGGGTAAVPALMVKLVTTKAHRFTWKGPLDSVPFTRRIPTVYFFFDPNCVVCHTEYQDLSRYVTSGQLHVEMIPVGFLKPDSKAKSVAIMDAADPDKAFTTNESNFDMSKESGGIAPDLNATAAEIGAIDDNTKLLALVDGEKYLLTPTLLVQDPQDGTWVRITSEIAGPKLVKSLDVDGQPTETTLPDPNPPKGVAP